MTKISIKIIKQLLIHAVILAFLFAGVSLARPDSAPELFSETEVNPLTAQSGRSDVKRSRVVQIRDELLGMEDWRFSENISNRLRLNLFDDLNLTATLDRLQPLSKGGNAWIGRIAESRVGSAVIIIRGGTVVGSIRSDKGWYQLRPVTDNLLAIHEIDHAVVALEDTDYITLQTQKDTESKPALVAGDGPTIIDVMVVYTPLAVTNAGGQATLDNLIDLAFVETNLAYSNSGIDQQVQLAGSYEVNYMESGDFPTDLDRLIATNDGYMDEVHPWRDENAADLVSLWVGNGSGGYSIWIETPGHSTAEAGFSVMGVNSGGWVFAHELGHNMGGHHDWYVNDEVVTYSYNKGYVRPYEGWKTIMAYNDLCLALGESCPPILYFSNPEVSYEEVPTGVPAGTSTACTAGNTSNPDCDADNRTMLNQTADIISQYRIKNNNLSGLLAYYPFDGNASDSSGNGFHGTVNGASLTKDRFGNQNSAYYFNGTDAHIQVPVNIDPGLWPRLTIVAWAKPESITPVKIVLSHDDGGFDRTIGIDTRGGGDGWSCFTGTGEVLGYHPASQGEWVFLAVTYDQYTESTILYVNDSKYEGTGKCYSGYDYIYIGASPGYGEHFEGAIDDVRIYSRVLSEQEINRLYKNQKTPHGSIFLLLGT